MRFHLACTWLFAGLVLGPVGAMAADASSPVAEPVQRAGLIDEVRFGGAFYVDEREEVREEGLFVTGELLFASPFRRFENPLLNALLQPRPHVGALVSTDGGTSQAYAGLTWHLPLWSRVFLEASFGGTVHDGLEARREGEIRPGLGCPVMFRESASIGVEVGARWRVLATIDHSSHASLCDGRNDGLTHVGLSAGYRF